MAFLVALLVYGFRHLSKLSFANIVRRKVWIFDMVDENVDFGLTVEIETQAIDADFFAHKLRQGQMNKVDFVVIGDLHRIGQS